MQKSNVIRSFLRDIALASCLLLFVGNSWGQSDSSVDSLSISYHQAIKNAKDSFLKLEAYYDYAVFLDEKGDFDQAVSHLNRAKNLAEYLEDYALLTKVYNYLGGMYWAEGLCQASTNEFEAALEFAEKEGDEELVALVKMNLSGNYTSSGQENKAIEYSLDALRIKESNNNIEGICFDYVTIGEIFQSIGNIEKWKLYIKKAYALKDNRQCAAMTDLVMIYNNLGSIAEAEKQYDQALAYYDTMIQVSTPSGYYEGIGIGLLNSALIYQFQEKPQKALELTIESKQYLGDVPYFIMATNNVMAELLQVLNRRKEALTLVTQNFKNENLDFYPDLKQKCLILLYDLNFEMRNYQQAYNWNDSLRAFEEKLQREENHKTIEELETKYETDKKIQQIELLRAENKFKEQQNLAFVASLIALVLLCVAGVLWYFKIKRENQYHRLELKQQLLRSQMNPHFLFNALGSIQNFMYKNETKKAAGYLGNFARLTRSILEHSAEEFVSLYNEIEMLRNYIELEKMRLYGKFNYEIEVDDAIETEFINVPPMLLQPFVENAIKHGLKEVNTDGLLQLKFREMDNIIHVEICDNGVGIDKAEMQKSSTHRSMSMEIFKERRKILSKKANRNIECVISDRSKADATQQGTRVEIQIPIE